MKFHLIGRDARSVRPPQWKFSANIHSQPRIYQGRTVRSKCIRIWRMRVCRECRLRWTHEPCVPTGQVNFRLLPRRHNMTSLRSLYVPHGLLTTNSSLKNAGIFKNNIHITILLGIWIYKVCRFKVYQAAIIAK